MTDSPIKPPKPVHVFVYSSAYLVDLDYVISAQPAPAKGQVTVQLKGGGYSTWYDVHDPEDVARQITAAKLEIDGVCATVYKPSSSARCLGCVRQPRTMRDSVEQAK
jgi:hypothetical protein